MIVQLGASSGSSVRGRYGPRLSSRARRRRGSRSSLAETFDLACRSTPGESAGIAGVTDTAGDVDGMSGCDVPAALDDASMRHDRAGREILMMGRAVITPLPPRAVRCGLRISRALMPIARRMTSSATSECLAISAAQMLLSRHEQCSYGSGE